MNKETKLQFVQLFKTMTEELEIADTPEFDAVNFMPIVSDRHAHTNAVLSLARDVAAGCETTADAETELVA
jgi:hypothetical protein